MSAPVWTSPPTAAVGHIETADEFNALVGAGGDLDFLHVAKAVRVRASSDQNLPNSTNTTVTWDTEDFDLFACHESVTHPSRLTIPSALTGIWIVRSQIEFEANATGQRFISINKNGTLAVGPKTYDALSSGVTTASIVSSFSLSAGDYLEIIVQQTTGGALNVDHGSGLSFFEAIWRGSTT